MKKLIIALFVVGLLLMVNINMATANGGPHGGYTATTDACAGCHRTHTADGAGLLVTTSVVSLCNTCHGTGAAMGANTNTDDGIWSDRGTSTLQVGLINPAAGANDLLGGGFVNYNAAVVTAEHEVDGSDANAWGFGAAERGEATVAITSGAVTCASCHNPHGNANYRILTADPAGDGGTLTVTDEATKDYDTEAWPASFGISPWCADCHDGYDGATGSGSSADAETHPFTHAVEVDMTGYGGSIDTVANAEAAGTPVDGDDFVVCLSCHFPHGSSVAAVGYALGTYDPGSGAIPSGDNAILRLDNRGVCEACHNP